MHGRPRQPPGVQEDPDKAKASQKRIALYSKLTTAMLTRRAAKQYDEETLTLAGKLLEQNPELYTVWNYRREALQEKLKGADGPEAARQVAGQELQLTQAALIRNPKSYGSWHYRKWITEHKLFPLEDELQLVQQFLLSDSRNFHTWAYWRWLVKLMCLSPDVQEAFTLGKIEENFSNYSAWHERTRVLQQLNTERPTLSLAELLAADSKQTSSSAQASTPQPEAANPLPDHALQQEYELVKNAFYTEPHDQSSWLYLRWLVGNSLAQWEKAKGTAQEASARQTLEGVIESQVDTCQEVLQLEQQISQSDADRSGQKWPLLTLARLRELQHQLSGDDSTDAKAEAQQIYKTLQEIDPMRKGYYTDAMQGKAAQVTRALNSAVTA